MAFTLHLVIDCLLIITGSAGRVLYLSRKGEKFFFLIRM